MEVRLFLHALSFIPTREEEREVDSKEIKLIVYLPAIDDANTKAGRKGHP